MVASDLLVLRAGTQAMDLRMFKELVLDKYRVVSSKAVGLQDLKMNAWLERASGELVLMLEGFVLAEDAGPKDMVYGTVTEAKFPWWIPKWLQRRWSETKHYHWTLQPRYLYPSSNVAVPALG